MESPRRLDSPRAPPLPHSSPARPMPMSNFTAPSSGFGFGSFGRGSFGSGGSAGETAHQLAHGLSSSMQRALGGLAPGLPTELGVGMASSSLVPPPRAGTSPPLPPDLQLRPPALSPRRSGASEPNASVHVELRPGETIEISSPPQASRTARFGAGVEIRPSGTLEIPSPQPSFRAPRLGAADTTAATNVEESERRRIEIASLRQEVASLLRMNSSLHMRLNQANTREQTSTAGSFAHLDASVISETKNPLAWIEERKLLEERAHKLTEECRALENEKAALELRVSVQAEPPSLAGLVRDRDDMKQRLHATELARCAAERRVATAEAALARSMDEMSNRRARVSGGTSEEARFGPWLAEEVKSLRRELSQEQNKLDDVNLALARKNEQVTKSEREHAEARVEYDALVAANETFRKDIASMKDKVEADRQASRSAEAELGELQAQFRLREFDLNTELQDAKNRCQSAETSLRERRSHLEASEVAAAAAKAEGLELKGQLDVLRAAHDELLAQEQREVADHDHKASELRARAEAVAADRAELEKHLEQVESATRELQASDAECIQQRENASRELETLRSRSNAMARQSQESIVQAEQRIQALLQQLGEERQQNLELERQISIAKEAAGEVGSAPWVVASEKAAGKPKGWASTAFQMHRELEMLQRWKNTAMDSIRLMQGDMDAAKRQYQQQLQHNQGLQERLEQMGHQAKTAMAMPGFTSVASGHSAGSHGIPAVPPATSLQAAPLWPVGTSPAYEPTVAPLWPVGTSPAYEPTAAPLWPVGTSPAYEPTARPSSFATSAPAWPSNVGFSATTALQGAQSAIDGGGGWPEAYPHLASGPSGGNIPIHSSSADCSFTTCGPDLPERTDIPAHKRAGDMRLMSGSDYTFAAHPMEPMANHGTLSSTFAAHPVEPMASHGILSSGPVGGPFYDAFRRQGWPAASRTAGRAELPGSRRRRSASAGRSSAHVNPVIAPLLSNNGPQVGRPFSAGGNGRRR